MVVLKRETDLKEISAKPDGPGDSRKAKFGVIGKEMKICHGFR